MSKVITQLYPEATMDNLQKAIDKAMGKGRMKRIIRMCLCGARTVVVDPTDLVPGCGRGDCEKQALFISALQDELKKSKNGKKEIS